MEGRHLTTIVPKSIGATPASIEFLIDKISINFYPQHIKPLVVHGAAGGQAGLGQSDAAHDAE
jgi:hypothetical protein